MKKKIINVDEAVEFVKDGMVLHIGGFLGCGTPENIIDRLVEKGTKNLTIVCNDTSFVDFGIGKLVANGQVKKVITSHIGTNPETGRRMQLPEDHPEKIEVELSPQGTLAERVRAAGYGLGGVLTPTGLGTIVEEGKDVITVDGKKFILEKPIKADVALIYGTIVDKRGNAVCELTTKNFNPVMATAADLVIIEAEKVVEFGDIDPDHVNIPRVFIDYIVERK